MYPDEEFIQGKVTIRGCSVISPVEIVGQCCVAVYVNGLLYRDAFFCVGCGQEPNAGGIFPCLAKSQEVMFIVYLALWIFFLFYRTFDVQGNKSFSRNNAPFIYIGFHPVAASRIYGMFKNVNAFCVFTGLTQ